MKLGFMPSELPRPVTDFFLFNLIDSEYQRIVFRAGIFVAYVRECNVNEKVSPGCLK